MDFDDGVSCARIALSQRERARCAMHNELQADLTAGILKVLKRSEPLCARARVYVCVYVCVCMCVCVGVCVCARV